MISVIMPAYNAEKTIGEAIESVLGQTYTDIELIVVNDFSKDRTDEIVNGYIENDSRIVYVKNSSNMGVSKTRNIAVAQAKGEWIAFLDSDDAWEPEKLEKQMDVAHKGEYVLLYTASSFINDKGEEFSYIMEAEEKTDYKLLLKRNIISCSSVLVKADVMKQIKMPHDGMHEDYYVWLTILKKYGYAYGVNEPLLRYRLSSNSKSSNRFKSARMLYNSYRALGYNFFVSSILTSRYFFYSIDKRNKISKSKEA